LRPLAATHRINHHGGEEPSPLGWMVPRKDEDFDARSTSSQMKELAGQIRNKIREPRNRSHEWRMLVDREDYRSSSSQETSSQELDDMRGTAVGEEVVGENVADVIFRT